MRQGIILFADAPAGPSAAAELVSTVEAALATGASVFVAYPEANRSAKLREAVGGPPPRFFPQAARDTLGERMAQAFAFLFVQDFERVLLLTGPEGEWTPSVLGGLLTALEAAPIAVESRGDRHAIALVRADFPAVAAVFEDVDWQRSGAKARAGEVLEGAGLALAP